jgi:hypothetical protein
MVGSGVPGSKTGALSSKYISHCAFESIDSLYKNTNAGAMPAKILSI